MIDKEEVLREFGEWIKTQPIYVGGGLTDREVLVIRDGKFESAIEVYLKERIEDDYSRGYRQGFEDATVAYERRISNMEMPIPKFVEDKTYTDTSTDCLDEDAKQASIPY